LVSVRIVVLFLIEFMGNWLYTNIISSCLHTRIDNQSYTLPRMSVMLNNYDLLTLRQHNRQLHKTGLRMLEQKKTWKLYAYIVKLIRRIPNMVFPWFRCCDWH
jgi:hypothetical protein